MSKQYDPRQPIPKLGKLIKPTKQNTPNVRVPNKSAYLNSGTETMNGSTLSNNRADYSTPSDPNAQSHLDHTPSKSPRSRIDQLYSHLKLSRSGNSNNSTTTMERSAIKGGHKASHSPYDQSMEGGISDLSTVTEIGRKHRGHSPLVSDDESGFGAAFNDETGYQHHQSRRNFTPSRYSPETDRMAASYNQNSQSQLRSMRGGGIQQKSNHRGSSQKESPRPLISQFMEKAGSQERGQPRQREKHSFLPQKQPGRFEEFMAKLKREKSEFYKNLDDQAKMIATSRSPARQQKQQYPFEQSRGGHYLDVSVEDLVHKKGIIINQDNDFESRSRNKRMESKKKQFYEGLNNEGVGGYESQGSSFEYDMDGNNMGDHHHGRNIYVEHDFEDNGGAGQYDMYPSGNYASRSPHRQRPEQYKRSTPSRSPNNYSGGGNHNSRNYNSKYGSKSPNRQQYDTGKSSTNYSRHYGGGGYDGDSTRMMMDSAHQSQLMSPQGGRGELELELVKLKRTNVALQNKLKDRDQMVNDLKMRLNDANKRAKQYKQDRDSDNQKLEEITEKYNKEKKKLQFELDKALSKVIEGSKLPSNSNYNSSVSPQKHESNSQLQPMSSLQKEHTKILESRVEDLEAEVRFHEQKNNELRERINEFILQSGNPEGQGGEDKVRETLRDNMAEIENLKMLRKEEELRFKDYRRTAEEREIMLNKEVESLKNQYEDTTKKLEQFKAKYRDLESSMEKMKDEHTIKASTFKNELAKISEMVNDLANENESLKRQIEILADNNEVDEKMRLIDKEFKEQINIKKNENDRLKKQIQELEGKIMSFSSQNQKIQDQKSTLRDQAERENIEKSQKITTLEEKLYESQTSFDQMKRNYDSLRGEYRLLKEQHEQLERAYQRCQNIEDHPQYNKLLRSFEEEKASLLSGQGDALKKKDEELTEAKRSQFASDNSKADLEKQIQNLRIQLEEEKIKAERCQLDLQAERQRYETQISELLKMNETKPREYNMDMSFSKDQGQQKPPMQEKDKKSALPSQGGGASPTTLREKDNEITRLTMHIRGLESQISHYRAAASSPGGSKGSGSPGGGMDPVILSEKEAEIAKLQTINMELEQKIKEYEEEKQQFEASFMAVNEQINEKDKDVEKIKGQIAEKENQIAAIQKELEEKKADSKEKNKKIKELEYNLDKYSKLPEPDIIEKDLKDKDRQIEEEQTKNIQALQQIQALQGEIEKAKNKITDVTQIQKRNKELEDMLAKIQQKGGKKDKALIDELNQYIDKLNTTLVAQQKKYEKRIDDLENQVQATKNNEQFILQSFHEQDEEIAKLKEKLKTGGLDPETEAEIEKMKEDIARLEKENAELKKAMEDVEQLRKDSVASKPVSDTSAVTQKVPDTEDAAALKEQIETNNTIIAKQKKRIKDLEEEKKKLSTKVEQLEEEKENLVKENESFQEQVSDAYIKYQEEMMRAEALKQQVDKLSKGKK